MDIKVKRLVITHSINAQPEVDPRSIGDPLRRIEII
jgi:hypothetical protein